LLESQDAWVPPGYPNMCLCVMAAADPNKLYFTAGSNGEADGLFGSLGAVRASDHDSDDKAAANLEVGMSTTAE
jgi:hypothetical protein